MLQGGCQTTKNEKTAVSEEDVEAALSRKRFLTDLSRISIGMSETDVRVIMAVYKEGTDLPADIQTVTDLGSGKTYDVGSGTGNEHALKKTIVFRHSNHWLYNADWGIVQFENGRVISVDFSPD